MSRRTKVQTARKFLCKSQPPSILRWAQRPRKKSIEPEVLHEHLRSPIECRILAWHLPIQDCCKSGSPNPGIFDAPPESRAPICFRYSENGQKESGMLDEFVYCLPPMLACIPLRVPSTLLHGKLIFLRPSFCRARQSATTGLGTLRTLKDQNPSRALQIRPVVEVAPILAKGMNQLG